MKTSATLSKSELVARRLRAATCRSCVYLHGAAEADFIGQGRRNAPGVGLVTLASENGVSPATRPIWALVKASDSCGEYLRRPIR